MTDLLDPQTATGAAPAGPFAGLRLSTPVDPGPALRVRQASPAPPPPAPRGPRAPADLPAVGLAELDALAALQTRRDVKYLVPGDRLTAVLAGVPDGTRVLEIEGRRAFGYESVYFDTADLVAHRAAAHRRPRRFKVRSRLYVDSGLQFLEVKTKDRHGNTVKQRIAYPLWAHGRLTPEGLAFAAGFAEVAPHAGRLRPALLTRYSRTTLLLPGPTHARVTLDTGLVVEDRLSCGEQCRSRGDLHASAGFGDLVVVETKTSSWPSPVDRLLWAAGHRPLSLSKYSMGVALLDPDQPANKWHRGLVRVRSQQ